MEFHTIAMIVIVGGGILVWFLFKAAGHPCPVCGASGMTPMASLSQPQQKDIREYFRQVERRHCREEHVLVCSDLSNRA